jgi:hypothetical protein
MDAGVLNPLSIPLDLIKQGIAAGKLRRESFFMIKRLMRPIADLPVGRAFCVAWDKSEMRRRGELPSR